MSLFGKSPPSSQHSLESFKAQILSSSCKILESRKLLSPWQNISHLTKSINHLSSKTCSWPVEQPKHMEIPNQVKSEFGSDQVIWFSRNQRFCILLKLQEIQFPKLLLAEADHYLWSPLVSLPSTEIYHYLSPSSVSPLQSHKSTISFPPSHPVALLSILIAKNLHSVFPKLDLLSM